MADLGWIPWRIVLRAAFDVATLTGGRVHVYKDPERGWTWERSANEVSES